MATHAVTPEGQGTETSGVRLEQFQYDDAIVRKFLTAMVVWGFVGMLVGLIVALQLVLPVAGEGARNFDVFGMYPLAWAAGALDWLSSILTGSSFLNFGRLRPLHTNAVIFAFAGNAVFAAVYYSTQRLCKARMYSDTLSALHFWGWQAIIVSAALTLPLGITQSKEYAELEWPIDLAIAVVWLGFFGVNFFGTLMRRREPHMYVALWFYIATIVTVTVLHVGNNIWLPVGVYHLLSTGEVMSAETFAKSYTVYSGAQDAFMQWWYGHNAVAFFLTTPFLGMMYYFMPKAAERPVFSYRLSIVHFWSLVFMYIWAGPHHLHYTALPAWASSLGMLFSVMLWMPSWGGGINGLLTLRGAWHKVTSDPVLKFCTAGITFYMMSTFEGPMLSVKSVNALSHYTDWTIAHVHSGALGWNGFMAFGMMYWLLPRLFQTPLYSKRLAETHFWLGTAGILVYVIPIYWAGITQGLMWRAFDQSGELQFPDFVETTMRLMPMYWLRIIGGSMYLLGVVLAAYNMFRTWQARPATYEAHVQTAPAMPTVYRDPPKPKTRLDANTEWGKAGDVWLQAWWHRVMERRPLKFTVWVVVAVILASAFEMLPMLLIRPAEFTIKSVQPYTPLELAGRDIYISEGCYNCHSQMIRPLWAETKRYGDYSKAGEFVYDKPFQWGSRRIGPDLAREGGARSHAWHYEHFENPRHWTSQSIMPSYAHLLTQELDYPAIQARVNAMAMLGVPYGPAVKGNAAVEMARAQAAQIAADLRTQLDAGGRRGVLIEPVEERKVIALIAYMQRLGTDIHKAPSEETPATAEQPAGTSPHAEAPTTGEKGA